MLLSMSHNIIEKDRGGTIYDRFTINYGNNHLIHMRHRPLDETDYSSLVTMLPCTRTSKVLFFVGGAGLRGMRQWQ